MAVAHRSLAHSNVNAIVWQRLSVRETLSLTIFQHFNKALGLLAHAFISLTIAISVPLEALGYDAQEVPRGWPADWSDTGFSRTSIRFGEIRSGGVPRDGIPAINDPALYTRLAGCQYCGYRTGDQRFSWRRKTGASAAYFDVARNRQ